MRIYNIFIKRRSWNYEYDFEYDCSINKLLKSIFLFRREKSILVRTHVYNY